MKIKKNNQKVIFCTFANFRAGTYGDAINDRKLYKAIPAKYNKLAIFPLYKKNNKIPIKAILKFYAHYLKEIVISNNIIITRGGKLAILPILLRPFFKNKVVLRLGCTPLMFVERKAFLYKENLLNKIFYFFEPQLEKFALRHADRFIVENNVAKRIIFRYGAKSYKIKIIPYYIQDYFLHGTNPDFNKEFDFFKIGYIGRFKKYDLLNPIVHAVNLLIQNKYKIKLFLIGDGPNRKAVENLVKKLHINENIKFLGSKSHIEVSRVINEYHCLIAPMLSKLCPSTIAIKILEGVMNGKIIITTESGNNPSLFLNNNDLILKDASFEDIEKKIEIVIKNYKYYKETSEKIRDYHLKFRSKSISTKKLDNLLTEII
ncbi:MAG: glycosyltransferase family 4 protein [Promethearchaeota archaeon]